MTFTNLENKVNVAFFLDGYGNRRHYYQIETLKEGGYSPKLITFLDGKPGYLSENKSDQNLVIVLPFRRGEVKKRLNLKFIKYLLNILRKENVKIVLTHRYKILRYLCLCKILFPSLKIIFHVVIKDEIKGWHQRLWFRLFSKQIDRILVNSKALKEDLINKGLVAAKNIDIFYSGVDLKDFEVPFSKEELRKHFSLNEESIYFGMLAQFRKEKGQRSVIKALGGLLNRGFKANLVFAGDGEKIGEAKKLVQELGLQQRVLFLGKISPREVPLFLKALDIFVYATKREGMPLAVLEAMAAGLPIIATEAEGIPDIFENSECFGEMVPQGDEMALSLAMEKFLKLTSNERERLGQNAKKVVRERFSAEVLKNNTLKLFNSLLD